MVGSAVERGFVLLGAVASLAAGIVVGSVGGHESVAAQAIVVQGQGISAYNSYPSGPGNWPVMSCQGFERTRVCGYNCVSAYSQIRCAQTPFGACMGAYNQVVCNDPSPAVLRVTNYSPLRMQCRAANNRIACGYDCRDGYGEVACAATPWGRCVAERGHVTCFDPAL